MKALPSPVPLADAVSMVLISFHPPSFPCEHSVFRNEAATCVFLFTCLAETWLMTPVRDSTGACVKSFQSCLTLCDPTDCSPPGSSSMGFSRQEYWSGLPCPPPGDLPPPRDRTHVSFITGGLFTTHSVTREAWKAPKHCLVVGLLLTAVNTRSNHPLLHPGTRLCVYAR